MKKSLIVALIILVVCLAAFLSYSLFRSHYVRFPTWTMDARYELVSVDQSFVIVNKPLAVTNSMFFPIRIYLVAVQATCPQGNLVALMNVNRLVKLEGNSVTDVDLRITIPLSLMNQFELMQCFDMDMHFDGTIQGSVYRIPFTKRISGIQSVSPDEDLVNDVLLPLMNKIKNFSN